MRYHWDGDLSGFWFILCYVVVKDYPTLDNAVFSVNQNALAVFRVYRIVLRIFSISTLLVCGCQIMLGIPSIGLSMCSKVEVSEIADFSSYVDASWKNI